MEFNENKFEMMSHGNNDANEPGKYKTKSGEDIKPRKTVKDLQWRSFASEVGGDIITMIYRALESVSTPYKLAMRILLFF